jgi:hypothetical protein
MKKIIYLLAGCLFILSCNDEAYDDTNEDPNNSTPNFLPNGSSDYWIYDVENSSEDVSEMNFTATDSIYVDSGDETSFMLGANNNGIASGTMNILLTNGTISKTTTTLVFDGNIDVPQNLLDLGFTQDLSIENMTLLDLNASNNQELFVQEANFSESIDIMETTVPVEVTTKISTKKINFYSSQTVNGINYDDVFEAEFVLNIGINGIFSVAGFTQTVAILEAQDVMNITYFYVNTIGLVRAETVQRINISSQLTALLDFLNMPLDFPTNISIEGVEELRDYATE